MKFYAILLSTVLIGGSCISTAQDVGGKTLVSQSRTTTANIGNCDIVIKYHSPSVNGRKIFGGIVPFDFVVDGVEYPWRAGSNQRTTIDFSKPVEIEGQKLDSGSYGFLVLVSEKEWTLIFSSGKSWGAFNYDKSNDVIRVPVKTKKVPFQEWPSYEFVNPGTEAVDIQLRWEETAVSFSVKTDALQNMISDLLAKEEKKASDYQELFVRTLDKDPSNKQDAMKYLEKSFTKLPDIENEYLRQAYAFNYKILKSEMLLEDGKKKEAEKLRTEALASANGFNIYYYALRKYTVEGKKKEALEVLKQQVKVNPDNFQNHFAFGEYYLKEGNQQKAMEHFKKAYDMTLEQESRWVNYARYLYLQNKLVLENN
ncbi:DUF2911 domain-containing protein [Ekhidna sp. To15]|uniref:DUF2911 domain-containing protein n=1 Tax=Ekhidna sp. To15 TaxID=3395267 RepID=UPI003F520CCC